jgi:NAD(P)-dependent dehydrogenase (short-subunit alcohol dehydrogenase family)
MKKYASSFIKFLARLPLIFKSLKKIYKYGGYSTINVAKVNYGKILAGKKILITGGGAGIGLSIAKKCLNEGATVLITGRTDTKLIQVEKEIDNVFLKILVWDISKIDQIENNLEKAKNLLGGDIDFLVNNAGVISGVNFPNVKEEMWDEIYATNSKGLFFVTQALGNQWISRGDNKIKKVLNISSQGGFVGATYPYRMTKWDVAGFTQGLGIRLAPYGIIVNGIAPGIIATNMQKKFLKQNENVYCSLNPIQRFALPDEIAELAIFLLGDASNFIVGQTILCDGGYSIK